MNMRTYPALHLHLCDVCNDSCIEDEFHFILRCKKYDDMRKKYINPYYWKKPSAFKMVQLLSVCNIKLVQLLSVCNIKELNNLGKFCILLKRLEIT